MHFQLSLELIRQKLLHFIDNCNNSSYHPIHLSEEPLEQEDNTLGHTPKAIPMIETIYSTLILHLDGFQQSS